VSVKFVLFVIQQEQASYDTYNLVAALATLDVDDLTPAGSTRRERFMSSKADDLNALLVQALSRNR
jgi:hypothetical protein